MNLPKAPDDLQITLTEKSPPDLIFSSIIQAPDKTSAKLAIESVFSQNYSFLSKYYLPGWPTFNRLRQSQLIDRQWIKDEINFLLDEMDRGFIILEGHEGTGKTTFLAQLAYEWSIVHHFISIPQGFKGIQLAKLNLGTQIVREWDLLDRLDPNVFQETAVSKNFLCGLLIEASQKNKSSASNNKIIIILDGLEDIGIIFNPDSLGIPEDLPENVFVIISQSPDHIPFNWKKNAQQIHLGQDSSKHSSDLLTFCQKSLEDTSFDILRNQVKEDQLISILLEKSQGDWLLLTRLFQLLKNLNHSKITIEEIQRDLPDNLSSAYLGTFQNIKDNDHAEWYRYILPVLGVLNAYPEPIFRNQLILKAGLPVDFSISNHLLDQVLAPFLDVDLQERYQFNHPSLRAFLSGKLITKGLSLQEEAFSHEIIENSKQYHLRYSQEISSLWGKIEEGLPALRDLKQLSPQDHYGLDYFPLHLEGSGSIADLHRIFLIEWPTRISKKNQPGLKFRGRRKNDDASTEGISKFSNGWYETKYSFGEIDSYLDDVQRAWKNSIGIEEHVLYALITSSVLTTQSQTDNSSTINDQDEQEQLAARLASSLAELGDPGRALAIVESITKSKWKNQAFAEIVENLPSQSIPSVLRYCQHLDDTWGKDQIISNCALRLTELSRPVQALEIANQLSSESLRNELFARLAKNIIQNNQPEMALEAINHISNESMKTDLLVEFSKSMDRDALQISLSLIRAFHDQNKKATAIAGLAPYLPNALQRDCFQWLDQFNEVNRSKVLVGLIPHLRETLLKDALSAARDIKDETLRAPVIVELSVRTAATGEPAKALKLMQAILGESYKASAIQGLAQYLTEEQRYEALRVIQTFKDLNSQNRAYEGLIPYLYDPLLTEILEKAYLAKGDSLQATILKIISKRYIDLGETARAIEIIRNCTSRDLRAILLAELASLWPETLRSEILTMTLALDKPELLVDALVGILPFLSHTSLLDALYVIIQLPSHGWLGINRRSELLIQTSSLLAKCGDIERSFSILREFTDDENISKSVLLIFPLLPDESHAAGLSFVQLIQDPMIRIQTLAAILPMLSESQIENVWSFLDNLADERLHLQVLNSLSYRISPEQITDFVRRISNLQDRNIRAQAFSGLIPSWLHLPVTSSLALWKDLIHKLSHRSRPVLLLDLRSLAPVIGDLGGINAINSILKSVKDVAKWWN